MVAVRLADGTWKGLRGLLVLFLFLILAFALGIVGGSLFINIISDQNKALLGGVLATALDGFRAGTSPAAGEVFARAAAFNLKTAALVWFLGLSVVGIPLVILVLFLRGFIVGFSVGFLYYERGFAGLLFSLAAILPSMLLAVPALLALGALAIAFAVHRRSTRVGSAATYRDIIRYTGVSALLVLLLLAASAIEGYGAPLVAAWLFAVP